MTCMSRHALTTLSFATCLACTPSQEAARVELPVVVVGAALVDVTGALPGEFELDWIAAAAVTLGVQLRAHDPGTDAHLFDGVDFSALDGDGDDVVAIVPGDAAHNVVRRALQSHVFFLVDPA